MNKKFSLLSLSDRVRAAGRGRDTVLAHITPEEAALLKTRGGRGTENPKTGLIELADDSGFSAPVFVDFFTPSFTDFSVSFFSPPAFVDFFTPSFMDFTTAFFSAPYVDPYSPAFVDFTGANNFAFVDFTPAFVEPYVAPSTFVDFTPAAFVDPYVAPYVDFTAPAFVDPYVAPYVDFTAPYEAPYVDPYQILNDFVDPLSGFVSPKEGDITGPEINSTVDTTKIDDGLNPVVETPPTTTPDDTTLGSYPGVLPDGTRRGDPGYNEKVLQLIEDVKAGTSTGRDIYGPGTLPDGTRRGDPGYAEKLQALVEGVKSGTIPVVANSTFNPDLYKNATDTTGDVLAGKTSTDLTGTAPLDLTNGATADLTSTDNAPIFSYTDPTAGLRSQILGDILSTSYGNASPDALYRAGYGPEAINQLYSDLNPNFAVDTAGTDVASSTQGAAPGTEGSTVDAQGNPINPSIPTELNPTVTTGDVLNAADLPSANATDVGGSLRTMSPSAARSFAAQQGMQTQATDLKSLADEAADAAGIRPQKLYGIIAGESLHKDTYDTNISKKEESYGPLQLNRMGGLGATFEKETGLDLTDPNTIPAQMRWVAEYLAQNPNMNIAKTWYGYRGENVDWNNSWGNAGFAGAKNADQLPPGVSSYSQITPPADIPIKGTGTSTDPIRGSDYATGPSTMDKVVNAIPGAAVDYGLGAMIPLYGAGILAGKVVGWATGNDYQSPGSMIASNLLGGPGSFGNAPASAVTKDYTRPAETPAEISRLPQTAGGTPIISEPATGPIQYPPATIGEGVTTQNAVPPTTTQDFNASTLPGATSFGQNIRTNFTGNMSYTPDGSDVVRSIVGNQSTGDVVAKEYAAPFVEPDKKYTLPEELSFSGKGEQSPLNYTNPTQPYTLPDNLATLGSTTSASFENPKKSYALPEDLANLGKGEASILDYQNPENPYVLPNPLAEIGKPKEYSPPFQPINKPYVLPEAAANAGKPATPSPLDYNNPATKYVLPPALGGGSPKGLTISPDVASARTPVFQTGSSLTSSGLDAQLSKSGGIGGISMGGGASGGGVGGGIGGGGGGRPSTATDTGTRTLPSYAASDFNFSGIAGGRNSNNPIVANPRQVDFGNPSREQAFALNIPTFASATPQAYSNYLLKYKQTFG